MQEESTGDGVMVFDAFFISPESEIIPVPDRHIVAIVNEPDLFGLTMEEISKRFAKHKETIGWEGYARNEIILELLETNWTRLRVFMRNGTWRLQVFTELNDTIKENILHFCKELKKGKVKSTMPRSAPPNIEIHNTKKETIFTGSLKEAIKFLAT